MCLKSTAAKPDFLAPFISHCFSLASIVVSSSTDCSNSSAISGAISQCSSSVTDTCSYEFLTGIKGAGGEGGSSLSSLKIDFIVVSDRVE